MTEPRPIVTEHSDEWHREKFAEFVYQKSLVGEPSPHMNLVVELSRNAEPSEQLWRIGCYCVPYSAFTGEVLWSHWPRARAEAEPEALLPWLREHWEGIQIRRPRRCVRTPEKFARSLLSYLDWSGGHFLEANAVLKGAENREYYDGLWQASEKVDFFGRYISIRMLEVMRRLDFFSAQIYDIRAIGGWSPVRALCLFYPERTEHLLGGDAALADETSLELMGLLKSQRIPVGFYELAACLCEYRVAYEDKNDYPSHQQDEELGYVTKFGPYWKAKGFEGQLLDVRSKLYPHAALGELQGWTGVRKECGAALRVHGYNWSDLEYDYVATTDFSSPERRAA